MFDFISDIFTRLSSNIYWDVVALVIVIGFGQGRYLCNWVWSRDAKLDGAWKTAALSLLIVPIYLTFMRSEGNVVLASRAVLSYVVATSLYELFIRFIRVSLKEKGIDIPPASERPDDYPVTRERGGDKTGMGAPAGTPTVRTASPDPEDGHPD